MPLYHYECPRCGHEMELRHGFDAEAPDCPACRGAMRRRLYPVGVVFRGSGFYSTDYRASRSDRKESPAKESDAPPKADGKAAGKSSGGKDDS